MTFLAGFALAACASGPPMPPDIGGKVVEKPPVQNFRGPPVVQITFLTALDPAAESEFIVDYLTFPVTSYGYGISRPSAMEVPLARLNLNGMLAKNVFYAFQMAKYLKMKADGDYAVILNPVILKYDVMRGYYYEPFEDSMPPYDIDLTFLSYVDPGSRPSNKGSVITTHGESLAPIVSVRMDPSFNPLVEGAVALTGPMIRHAHNPDGEGLRAQFIDYLNARKHGAPLSDVSGYAVATGPFVAGSFYDLDIDTFDLAEDPPPEEILTAEQREAWDYEPGTYDAYEFFEGYYRIIMSALQVIDNNVLVTAAQKRYWSYYEKSDLASVMLDYSDQGKRRFLSKAKQVELQYLQDRDDNWMEAVLRGNSFQLNYNSLRDAEQEARSDYIKAQIKSVATVLLTIAGGALAGYAIYAGSSQGLLLGSLAVGSGIELFQQARADLRGIDTAFQLSFRSAYELQRDYIFVTVEGERVSVRGGDYAKFKAQLKERYDKRFKREAVPIS